MFQRRAILHGYDSDAVAIDHHWIKPMAGHNQRVQRAGAVGIAQRDLPDAFVSQHHEERGVDGVGAGTQDTALRAALAAFGQRLAFRQRGAGAGKQIANAAHGN